MEIMRFEDELYLWGLVAVPLVLVLYFLYRLARKRALAKWGNPELFQRLAPSVSRNNRLWKAIMASVAVGLLAITLANLQQGSELQEVEVEGRDVVIALDLSRSMLAEDVVPSRLQQAKQLISRLLERLPNDRVGLIIFAGNAYLQMPLTTDKGAARLILSSLDVDVVPTQGTAIGEALWLANKAFTRADDQSHEVVLLITDGEDHTGAAIEAAEALDEAGATIFTVGVGSQEGSPIPASGRGNQYMHDEEGNIVFTKMNEEMLQEIAQAGNGSYFRLTQTQAVVEAITEELQEVEAQQRNTQVFTDYVDLFQWFLGGALLLMLLEWFIPERKR